ncbi:MAG: DUF2203 family protein [Planctomycetota bacterium]|jgi:hypothetical protein
MHGKLFTLEEANRRLPLVRAIAGDAAWRYRVAKEAIRGLQRSRARPRADREELARQERAIGRHLEELRMLVEELEALGCRLRDYERGAVDFPAARLDARGFVVYCWAPGEARVTHWHCAHEGHDERRLVGAAASA